MKSYVYVIVLIFSISCSKEEPQTASNSEQTKAFRALRLSQDFKSYWFDGTAEISSYALTQMRYGEARKGSAVLIFVKEPFLNDKQVKANQSSPSTTDVLKLNYTKNFNTGIYPYSIMQSVFLPLTDQPHAIKVTSSTQEWCGQTYMQLNNREDFQVTSHSYFEGEADQSLTLNKATLENEIWTKLRINPAEIATGQQSILPDFSYIRLKHIKAKAYQAEVSQRQKVDTLITTIAYKDIDRILKIYQNESFPFEILKWEEKETENDKNFTTAVLQKSMKIDYWNKNSNQFEVLRDSLQLK
jgi:hypothetical protein